MTIVNIIDSVTQEQQRLDFWPDYKVRVVETHGYAYLHARETYYKKNPNEKIGLETLENEENFVIYTIQCMNKLSQRYKKEFLE